MQLYYVAIVKLYISVVSFPDSVVMLKYAYLKGHKVTTKFLH